MNKKTFPRFLSLKHQTWFSILLITGVLLSSLLLVEANQKNAIVHQAQAETFPVSYPVNSGVRTIVLSEAAIEFGSNQVESLDNLLRHESGYQLNAINPTSGACGIFQNINCNYKSMNISDQIQWGFNYIHTRYGNPQNAWNFWQQLHLINGKLVHYY